MAGDRMGFGGDGDRFSAARPAHDMDTDSDDDDALNTGLARRRRSDVEMHAAPEEPLRGLDHDEDDDRRESEPPRSLRAGDHRAFVAATSARDRFMSDDTDIEEEMMRIDPVDLEWRRQLHVGDPIDAQNVFGNWCPAVVLRILDREIQVRYLNMNDSWQRWLPVDSGQLAPPATKTLNDSAALRIAQAVEVRKPGTSFWKEALVVKPRPNDLLVRYAGRQQQFDEWMPLTPDTVAPAGDHVRSRQSLSVDRRLRVRPTADRHRVIQTQNPRFQHYRDALAAHGLRIHAVEGDGNCLFRSVSHQVYGDDHHHGLVRRLCMDYMESEKEYFEPYVVGDMSAFLRYLQHKRRDGVWGDDPEIQAMCELYDRPAEVYAYDPAHGFRKLRTFHENSLLARNRPPICLSYYGGGHYDSIVSAQHTDNVIREPPGEWEARHLEISRRINTREGGGAGDGSILAQRVMQASSSSASAVATDMAQLEQILMLSRNEFDAMRSNLDDTLRCALADSERSAVDSEQRALDAATRESEMAAIQAELLEKAREASEEEQVSKALEASMKERHTAVDFDDEVSAAIQASLVEHAAPFALATAAAGTSGASFAVHGDDDEEEMRRILELSAKEYEATARQFVASTAPPATSHAAQYAFGGDVADNDELDELQRAIQASLRES